MAAAPPPAYPRRIKALDLGAGRWLLLRPYDGVLCSTDAGLTWRTRCSPIH